MIVGNAFTYAPPAAVDWLLCDVICEPPRTIELVDRWMREGRCRRVGTGAENSPCFTGRYGVDSCNPGLACSPATQTCRPLKAEGESCASGAECAVGVCVGDNASLPATECGQGVFSCGAC